MPGRGFQRRGVRHLGYHSRRTWRAVTARWRRLPDFLLLGAQKSGTSSLYAYICQHPNVLEALEKEIRYFGRGDRLSTRWYRSHFPLVSSRGTATSPKGVMTGEATPGYLTRPGAAAHAAAVVPAARLLVVLRDPVDRAYSHYQHMKRRRKVGVEFEALAARLPERVHRVFRLSAYADGLRQWAEHFPREHLLVLQAERFFADPAATMERVWSFLGLEPFEAESYPVSMAGGYADRMSADTRRRLQEYFAPGNEQLFTFLGERWDWDGPGA